MDTFIVSARKYRPQNFASVVGQQHITTTLKNAINQNQLAHAFLFCGPRGVGKTTCARILAKTINCEKRGKEGEACNKCNSCVSFDNGTSFNIHELDAASNNSVDDIRTLTEQVRFAPQAGKYKVYIVDEVHMLSSSAFNAFLKTLEEPPPFVIFILATTEKHKILPTILSRCQIFDFKRITNQDTTDHLKEICKKEGIEAESTALHLIAQKSEGCLRDALSILDKIVSFTSGKVTYNNTLEHLNILDEDYYFRLLDMMMQQNATDALLLFDEINQKGFEPDTLLEGMMECIRNILVSKDPKASALLETAEEFKPRYLKAANDISAGWLLASLNLLSEASIQIKQSRNKRLFIELLLIKLAYLNQAIELTTGVDSPAKKKLIDRKSPVAFRNIGNIVPLQTKTAPIVVPKQKTEPSGAVLLMEEVSKVAKPIEKYESADSVNPAAPSISLGRLAKIRQKIVEKEGETGLSALPMDETNVKIAWQVFVSRLDENKSHSASSNFRMAEPRPGNEQHILEIHLETDFQRKFIEAERNELLSHLRQYFNNPRIAIEFHVSPSSPVEEGPRTLTSREQYNQTAERYPMVRLLKERLRLEIDI
jgi:DNA polymerase-3 subunit gamma/tau